MRTLGLTLIQYELCPYKKGKSRHRDRCTHREDGVKTQGEDNCLQAEERALELILPLEPSERTHCTVP